jgi:hypothetical protein
MLSEAKHLGLFFLADRSRFDLRFFPSLRMTFEGGDLISFPIRVIREIRGVP